jgi:hypothetical protein
MSDRQINTALRFMLHVQGKAGPKWGRPRKPLRRHGFTSVPDSWEYRLRDARHKATWPVALYILRRSWETNGEPFRVTNVAMKERGIDRHRKQEALEELEALGLIWVLRHYRRSPKVGLRMKG